MSNKNYFVSTAELITFLLLPSAIFLSTPATTIFFMSEQKVKQKDENPLVNLIINVIAPVLILSKMSKAGEKAWHLGPEKAMYIALALPIAYGIWFLIKNKKLNIFSIVGIISVLLTGLITLIILNDASLRPKAALLFGIKEAAQPLLLGSLFLLTHRSKTPLFNAFIFNDGIFNIKKIESEIEKAELQTDYKALLWKSTLFFFGSFVLSAILNLFVAFYFLSDLTPTLPEAEWFELYNEKVGSIMGWGYLIIGVPLLVIGGFIFYYLISGLKRLTHFELEGLLHPR